GWAAGEGWGAGEGAAGGGGGVGGRQGVALAGVGARGAERERPERVRAPATAWVPAAAVDPDRHAVRAGREVDRAQVGVQPGPVQLVPLGADLAPVDPDRRVAVPVAGEPGGVPPAARNRRVDCDR